MTLETMIIERLSSSREIAETVTTYEGKPAIFFGRIPGETDSGWGEKGPYPKINSTVSRPFVSGRKKPCILAAEIQWTAKSSPAQENTAQGNTAQGSPPQSRDTVLSAVCEALSDQCFQTEDKGFCSLVYAGARETEASDVMYFELAEYGPSQISDPDPLQAIYQAVHEMAPEAGDVPCYCELKWLKDDGKASTAAVKWMKFQAAVHLFSRNKEQAVKMAAGLACRLAEAEELPMADGSPLFLKKVRLRAGADGWKEGQITVTGTYGLARLPEKSHSLTGVQVRS